jgi:hypothetical protein
MKYRKSTGMFIAKAAAKKKMTLIHESVGNEKALKP